MNQGSEGQLASTSQCSPAFAPDDCDCNNSERTDSEKNDNSNKSDNNDEENREDDIEAPKKKMTWRQRIGWEATTEQLAEQQARRLNNAADVLLTRLFSFLSKLPEEQDPEDQSQENSTKSSSEVHGITLPASAVGWLSSQLYQQELYQQEQQKKKGGGRNHIRSLFQQDDDDDEMLYLNDDASASSFLEDEEEVLWMGVAMRDRISLLKFLLPRATHIRITRDIWPPLEKDEGHHQTTKSADQNNRLGRKRDGNKGNQDTNNNNGRALLGQDLNCSSLSVNSALTTESMRPRRPSMEAFLRYYHNLQNHPRINIQRVFPNLKVLVMDSIPPTWIQNLQGVRRTLQVLRVERGSMYDVGSFFSPSNMNSPKTKSARDKKVRNKVAGARAGSNYEDPLATPKRVDYGHEYVALSHLKLSHCGIGELSGLRGSTRSSTTKFPPPLSRLPNLVSLSLAHNELVSERAALAGLSSLTSLTKLDLSFNRLSSLDTAYARLGQIVSLSLSHNKLTSARGIDRLYGLQRLQLDNNKISELTNIAGIGRLPELKYLTLHGNPFQDSNPTSYRVDVLNLFREQRVGEAEEATMTFRLLQQSLPSLDGKVASNKELVAIRDRTFRSSTMNVNQLQLPGQAVYDADNNASVQPEVSAKTATAPTISSPSASTQNGAGGDGKSPMVAASPVQEGNTYPTADLSVETSISSTPSRPLRYQRVRRGRPSRKARIINGAACEVSVATGAKQRAKISSQSNQHQSDNVVDVEKDGRLPHSIPTRTVITTGEVAPLVVANFSVRDVLSAISPSKRTLIQKEMLEMDIDNSIMSDWKPDFVAGEAVLFVGEADQTDIIEQITSNMASTTSCGADGGSPLDFQSNLQEIPGTTSGDNRPLGDLDHDYSVPADGSESRAIVHESSSASVPIHPNDIFKELSKTNGEDPASSGGQINSDGDQRDKPKGDAFLEGTNADKSSGVCESIDHMSSPARPPKQDNGIDTAQSSPKGSPKRSSTNLLPGPTRTTEFDIFSEDWDALVQRAAEGLIPDGIPRNPVAELQIQGNQRGEVFPLEATEELAPAVSENVGNEPSSNVANTPTIQSTASGDSLSHMPALPEPLPEHVWQDDSSVPSSLGTNRDDFPKANKYQLAEENAEYDGPEYCRDWLVMDNTQLYFNTFVFPGASLVVPTSLSEDILIDDDNWQTVALKYPRIQLWPEDRQWRETTSISETGQLSVDDAANREWLVKVWDEEVIPCGARSLKRLAPNRGIRLGFHGDALYQNSSPDPFSACRKVILCVSSAAFYVIVRDDKVTARAQEKKKKFPVPISGDVVFEDARWPHAVARHSFEDLVGITIGFAFQKLTLRFSNRSLRNTDLYTYVLLTSNKMQTVAILQELQRRSKDALELDATGDMLASAVTTQIDNDDRNCLDALAVAIAPDALGTVLNFSIVQQWWKHGGRGTVRRVCVVTDTKLFLLDEDYIGDGSTAFEGKNSKERLGDVRYRMVDEAALSQVAEVQAAGADPNSITIIINPLSRLSRTHRWRLLCRDSEGAERLVEDVRKAIDMQ